MSDRELLVIAMGQFEHRLNFGEGSQAPYHFLEKYPTCCSVTRTSYFWPFTGDLGWGLSEINFGISAPYKNSFQKSKD